MMFRALSEAENKEVCDHFMDIGLLPNQAGENLYQLEKQAKEQDRPVIEVFRERFKGGKNERD